MSWRPGNPVPQEFIDILFDEDDDNLEDDGELEEVYLEEEQENDTVDVSELPIFMQRSDSTLRRMGPGGDDVEDASAESDDEEQDWEQAHRVVVDAINPLTSPARDRTPSPIPVQDPAPRSAPGPARGPAPRFRVALDPAATLRGTASLRGRGRGRGRGGRGGGRVNERRWMRGDALQEMYINDANLPVHIQEQIRDHLAGRLRHVRRRTVDNVEEESEGNEKDEWEDFNVNEEFLWRGMDEWHGVKCDFVPELTGPTVSFRNPYEVMHAIWTDDIMTHIAQESNRYAVSVLGPQRPRLMRDWFETNHHEIWTLLAFWIMLGILRMPTIKSCFTRNPLLRTDIFRTLFTESRYWNVNAAFHLAEGTDPNNPLHPMGPIIQHLNEKFQAMYRLHQDICIDESLTLWKGPVKVQQYIKTKAARFGIKTYKLCESTTGYLWSFFVYVGRVTGTGNLPSSVSTVLRLVQPLLNLGHTLFMENWFNSPSLARWLKRRNTDCVGTLRPTRKGVPESIKRAPLQEGQFVARASDDVMVVAIQDRKRVTCISTYHDASQVRIDARPGHPAQHKLSLIREYNLAMGGVDRLDSMLEAYLVERKQQCIKWNRKLFKRLLNISIQNARIIVEKSTNTKIDSLAFRLALVDGIIHHHLPNVPRPERASQQCINPTFPLQRLTERHFIRRIPITEEMRATVQHRTNLGRRSCVLCTYYSRRSKTVYECAECGLALCLEDCFRKFHTINQL